MASVETRQLTFDELFHLDTADIGIEIDTSFPEAFANGLSSQEAFNKHLFRPNTYLHKWWARRCGTTFRTVLKQFVGDVSRRDFYAPGGLEGKIVLDPMMGGGTTLHEAIRLGANVIGADIDPIPVVQARATLASAKLDDLQSAFNRFFADLSQQIGRYFQTECPTCDVTVDSLYTLYGLRKRCDCGEVIQIDQYEIRQEADRTLKIDPVTWEITDALMHPTKSSNNKRLITKAETTCATCNQRYEELLDVPFYLRYVPIVIVGKCPQHGQFFRSLGRADQERLKSAEALRSSLDFKPLEHFLISDGPKFRDLLNRKIYSYLDLFSSRQLLYLFYAIKQVQKFEGTIRLNLALLVSTSLELNAMLCGYKGWFKRRPGAIRHVFGLHAYVFQYTVTENNPVSGDKSSGNLQRLFSDRIVRGRKWAATPIERKINPDGTVATVRIPGEFDGGTEVFTYADLLAGRQNFWLFNGDSRTLPLPDNSVDIIVTDPPYYDSVQYSDLAGFFRVWLARLLSNEIRWAYDETQSAVAIKTSTGDTQFLTVLAGIFEECRRVLKGDNGRMVFTFHHWQSNAWAELTLALKRAGFGLVNTYTVFSENPISAHINNLKAIKHDSILVLASIDEVAENHWPRPIAASITDSEAFCRWCASTLGWFLKSNCSPMEIREMWKSLMQGGT